MVNQKDTSNRLKEILQGLAIIQKNINHLIDAMKQLLKRMD
jgi:hypothetical protein